MDFYMLLEFYHFSNDHINHIGSLIKNNFTGETLGPKSSPQSRSCVYRFIVSPGTCSKRI